MSAGVARVFVGDAWRTAVYHEGRTRLHVVIRDDAGIRHVSLPLEESRHLQPVFLKGRPYPVKRAAKVMRLMPCGLTSGAKQHLVLACAEVAS